MRLILVTMLLSLTACSTTGKILEGVGMVLGGGTQDKNQITCHTFNDGSYATTTCK